ncbi:MAG: hypothetical protein ABI640_09140 [Gammaproteobacteria bacterium]
MMRSVTGFSAAAFAALLCACSSPPPEAPAAQAASEAPLLSVELDAEQQEKLGVEAAAAGEGTWQPSVAGSAQVVDPQELVAAMAEQGKAEAEARSSEAARKRARDLFGADTAVSAATLETAERQAAADAALLDVAQSRAALGFGSGAPWLTANRRDALLRALARGNTLLVRASFPGGLPNGKPTTLAIRRVGGGESWTAGEVWSAPADPGVPGPTLLALVPGGSGLSFGERLTATLPAGNTQTGAIVPTSAVVLAGGQSWCYVQSDEHEFTRRAIEIGRPTDAGYFQQSGIAVGDKIVTAGAGLLLARELGGAPAED